MQALHTQTWRCAQQQPPALPSTPTGTRTRRRAACQPCVRPLPPPLHPHAAAQASQGSSSSRSSQQREQQPMDAVQGVIEQLRGDPVLRKVLDSPKMQRVLEEMQKDPAAAMQRHAGDREVMAVLAKLTTFDMSRAQRRAIQDLGASPDELAKSIYGNRQLAIKLQQPHVRAALAEFRVDEQAAAAKYKGNAEINEVLDLLEASLGSGVIDV